MSLSSSPSGLVLGGVSFTLGDVTPQVDFDGELLVAVRQYPGGGFNAQNLGPYDLPTQFKGTFRWTGALDRALAVDRLRVLGNPVPFIMPGGISRMVLVTSVQLSVRNESEVDYDIKLQPVDAPGSYRGSTAALLAGMDSAPGAVSTQVATTYTVKAGDTLPKIAARYGTTWTAISQLNSLKSKTLTPGQTLLIPQ